MDDVAIKVARKDSRRQTHAIYRGQRIPGTILLFAMSVPLKKSTFSLGRFVFEAQIVVLSGR
jgi:hypothetical protein